MYLTTVLFYNMVLAPGGTPDVIKSVKGSRFFYLEFLPYETNTKKNKINGKLEGYMLKYKLGSGQEDFKTAFIPAKSLVSMINSWNNTILFDLCCSISV